MAGIGVQGFKSPWGRQALKFNFWAISKPFEIKIERLFLFFYPFFYPKLQSLQNRAGNRLRFSLIVQDF
jgi:hypothetical protein